MRPTFKDSSLCIILLGSTKVLWIKTGNENFIVLTKNVTITKRAPTAALPTAIPEMTPIERDLSSSLRSVSLVLLSSCGVVSDPSVGHCT